MDDTTAKGEWRMHMHMLAYGCQQMMSTYDLRNMLRGALRQLYDVVGTLARLPMDWSTDCRQLEYTDCRQSGPCICRACLYLARGAHHHMARTVYGTHACPCSTPSHGTNCLHSESIWYVCAYICMCVAMYGYAYRCACEQAWVYMYNDG